MRGTKYGGWKKNYILYIKKQEEITFIKNICIIKLKWQNTFCGDYKI